MARWEPNTRERIEAAAMRLYQEQGYEQTTVAEIAAQAGLSERTFFRHYTDKREVLFGGSEWFQSLFVTAIADAPPAASPIQAVSAALQAVGVAFEGRQDFARIRRTIIDSTRELQERELLKLATLGVAMGDALRARGVREPTASVTAQTALAIFRVAFDRWLSEPASTEPGAAELGPLLQDSLDELCTILSPPAA